MFERENITTVLTYSNKVVLSKSPFLITSKHLKSYAYNELSYQYQPNNNDSKCRKGVW